MQAQCEFLYGPLRDYKRLVTWRPLGNSGLRVPHLQLRHCGIYDSETVQATLVDWLKGQMPQGYQSSQVFPRSKYSLFAE
jgi:hypothetical protein